VCQGEIGETEGRRGEVVWVIVDEGWRMEDWVVVFGIEGRSCLFGDGWTSIL
jgi:hypothetical protein